ncbi:MAG: hypothetical protein V4644_01285 [Patescibacteria group bacterium]
MSVKKSWDVAPRAKKPAPALAKPSSRPSSRTMRDMHAAPRVQAPAKAAVPVSKRNVTIARGRKARPERKEPLKKRRKETQKALFIVIGILAILLLAGLFYLAWLPAFRVSGVSASGPHAEEAKLLAEQSLEGLHAFILPRDSLFFIPEDDMRARILAAHPDIEAVSVTADGLDTLKLETLPRAEAFAWCGTAVETPAVTCFSANAAGLIFAEKPQALATSSEALKVYAATVGQEGPSPVGSSISYASRIPEALRFVKALQTLGADIVSIGLRDDEADLYTEAGTRITYVLGKEQEAAGTAASVFPQLSLNDGSIRYVDLRFPGKAYFKRAGTEDAADAPATEPEPAQ